MALLVEIWMEPGAMVAAEPKHRASGREGGCSVRAVGSLCELCLCRGRNGNDTAECLKIRSSWGRKVLSKL